MLLLSRAQKVCPQTACMVITDRFCSLHGVDDTILALAGDRCPAPQATPHPANSQQQADSCASALLWLSKPPDAAEVSSGRVAEAAAHESSSVPGTGFGGSMPAGVPSAPAPAAASAPAAAEAPPPAAAAATAVEDGGVAAERGASGQPVSAAAAATAAVKQSMRPPKQATSRLRSKGVTPGSLALGWHMVIALQQLA